MIGALLAGGAGRRMAALAGAPGPAVEPPLAKPAVPLAGRPLAAWPLGALAAVCERIGVVAKRDTLLPALPGTERWDEPDEPRHPLTGILHALDHSGRAVLVCAADMPFVTPDALRSILAAAGSGGGGGARPAAAAVAVSAGVLQPVLGVYAPAAAETLRAAPVGAPLTAMVERLEPVRVALPERVTRSVNTPEDLAAAEQELGREGPAL